MTKDNKEVRIVWKGIVGTYDKKVVSLLCEFFVWSLMVDGSFTLQSVASVTINL